MNKEKTLSSKRKKLWINKYEIEYNYPEKDVKEFIKKLKEDLHEYLGNKAPHLIPFEINKIIDKLAGENLI